ncbi:MAG: hypothetical protein ACAI35_22185 [Candidatus Methylacidiphilales bacterium]|nr:hypothetical protein [Candidatus Methylacidiphilales bacterium]
MSCHYRYLITQHPVDGVKLGFRTVDPDAEPPLFLVVSGQSGTTVSFGCIIPEDYLGISGLLRYDPNELLLPLRDRGRVYPVIFPNTSANFGRPYAELLDSFRFTMPEGAKVTVILEYERIADDLPPMYPHDEVICTWEVRDYLSPEHLRHFGYLAERLDNESPSFYGLHLYTRQQGNLQQLQERVTTIRQLSGICSINSVITI